MHPLEDPSPFDPEANPKMDVWRFRQDFTEVKATLEGYLGVLNNISWIVHNDIERSELTTLLQRTETELGNYAMRLMQDPPPLKTSNG